MTLRERAWPIRPWLMAVAVLATAWHAPGQLSFDSVIALHEAATGQAFGWTPTFQSALLAWMGGGEVASALHVALMVGLTIVSLEILLRRLECHALPWRLLGVAMALNPLIWLMLGVVWRDVLLGVVVLAGSGALIATSATTSPRRLWIVWGGVALASAVAVLARQQGIILASALMLALFAKIEFDGRANGVPKRRRLGRMALYASVFVGALLALQHATLRTIAPPVAKVAMMDGWRVVMLYDIAGMLANRGPEAPAVMAPRLPLPDVFDQALRSAYSPERVDGVLAVPGLRDWAASQERRSLARLWWTALRDSPMAYVQHRRDAAWALLGGFGVRQCLPGYWGVAGPPMMLEALGMDEAMDARDRQIGRFVEDADAMPWLWNGTYVLMLLLALPSLLRRRSDAPVPLVLALGGLAYVAAYLVTTVACDVRYLFPVAMLTTAVVLAVASGKSRMGQG